LEASANAFDITTSPSDSIISKSKTEENHTYQNLNNSGKNERISYDNLNKSGKNERISYENINSAKDERKL